MTDTREPQRAGPEHQEKAGPAVWNGTRLIVVAAIVGATIEQARLAVVAADQAGYVASTALARLFSFFTVQSNLLAAVVLTVVAVRSFSTRFQADPKPLAGMLAAVSSYMVVTGIVYNAVLRAAGGADIMMGWSNNVHHVIAPVFMFLDVVVGPGRRAVKWHVVAQVLVFPLVWAAYTLVRGPVLVSLSTRTTPWYPYPFLDPTLTPSGYAGVAVWIAGIALVIALVAVLVVWIGRIRAARGLAMSPDY